MRRHVIHLTLLFALLAAAPALAGKPAQRSWAQAEIEAVVARGLMGGDAARFRPDDVLTQGEVSELVAALTKTAPARVAQPAARVTMAGLDARLVAALGLRDAAAAFGAAARTAGLKPPARFGTEVVARLLGLRKNHAATQDALERLPDEPATRAEAAYSVARILRFTGSEVASASAAAATFTLAALTPWQKQVLATAVRFVGFPYVWGGEFETRQSPFGAQAQGGFDCSGFAWRVYKLQPYVGAEPLAAALVGRTSMAMSGEVARGKRIPFAKLFAGDLVFFGNDGPRSKPADVDHMGIALGNGWIVHSSSAGVALAPLSGWYRERFAWGRRPLAEAGVEPTPPRASSK